MRPDFTRRRGGAEMSCRAAGNPSYPTVQSGAATCMTHKAAPLAHPLCASAPLREQKSTLSYSDVFTICSPRIGGQAHGA